MALKVCKLTLPEDAAESVFVCALYADKRGRLNLAFHKRRPDIPLAMVQTVMVPAISNLTDQDLELANVAAELEDVTPS